MVVGAVQGAPELQYGYLKGAMHAARVLEAAAAQQGADPASPRSRQRSPNDWLLSDPQVPSVVPPPDHKQWLDFNYQPVIVDSIGVKESFNAHVSGF
jgi:hypothetical protein